MLGRERAPLVAAALAAVLVVAGCAREARSTAATLVPPSSTTVDPKPPSLASRDYQAGDCVTWPGFGVPQEHTQVVPCTQAHHLQISGRVSGPAQPDFPSRQQWSAFLEGPCSLMGAQLLGHPVDPYGRFMVRLLRPTERGWMRGDRVVWCAVGAASSDPDRMISVDARGADQQYHYTAGQCVDAPPHAPEFVVVPCGQPHVWEITGDISYPDGPTAPPPGGDPRCDALAVRYLGHAPAAPWQVGYRPISPKSWAAGARTMHCFVAQFDGLKIVEVTGAATGAVKV